MGSLSYTELVVLLAVIILLFGSKRIPEFARGLGGSIRAFRGALHGNNEKEPSEPSK